MNARRLTRDWEKQHNFWGCDVCEALAVASGSPPNAMIETRSYRMDTGWVMLHLCTEHAARFDEGDEHQRQMVETVLTGKQA